MRLIRLASGTLCLVLAMPAQAHGLLQDFSGERLPLWLSALLTLAAWLAYLVGTWRVRPRPREQACFHLAMALLVFAVFGPLDDWAETRTSWHMTQHMLFMVVIAPLWVLARPLPQWRASLGSAAMPLWRGLLRATRHPTAMALLHGAVIWIWHTPALYLLALSDLGWHAVEHACFLLSAWLFWWSALRSNPRLRPQALMAILLTLMHTGLLGALLTFGTRSFYGPERDLADQQLAGLLMWVPGGLAYLAGGAWVGWRWLASRTRRHGLPSAPAGNQPSPRTAPPETTSPAQGPGSGSTAGRIRP